MIGKTISHYRMEAELGRGGMGVVYRATDLSLHRPVAIKFLSSEVATEERRRRFQQEAQTASSLNHPHILTVFEAGTIDGEQYLVTEFIDGWTLREWSRRETRSIRQIVELAITIADALACAHQAGIMHRDIKPENILISKDGYAKVVDFGLAKLLDSGDGQTTATRTMDAAVETRAGVVVGTIPYMSPEQIASKAVDARSDIFSFGVVLYEQLAGHRPFGGESDPQLIHEIRHGAPRPLLEMRTDAPYGLAMAVEKALEKEPAERYQAMREMVVDLKRVQRVRSSDAGRLPVPPSQQIPEPQRRRWWVGIAAVAVAVGAGATAGWLAHGTSAVPNNPLANAQFTRFTNFEGDEHDADISRDGKFVAFRANRDGPFDVWLSQIGSGQFANLTKGVDDELRTSVRSMGFSADGSEIWLGGAAFNSPVLRAVSAPEPSALWQLLVTEFSEYAPDQRAQRSGRACVPIAKHRLTFSRKDNYAIQNSQATPDSSFSILGLGSMTFGGGKGIYKAIGSVDQTGADELVKASIEGGINLTTSITLPAGGGRWCSAY